MSRLEAQPVSAGPAKPPAEGGQREYFADRDKHNFHFHLLVHAGAPLAASLLLHAALFSLLAWKAWDILDRPAPADFEAGIRPAGEDLAGGFKWPGEAELTLTAPEIAAPIEPVDFSNPTDIRDLTRSNPTGEIDTGGFGVGSTGRSGILGIGSGAGSGGGAGTGAGLGSGTGIGRAGLWNLDAPGNKFVYVVDYSGSIVVVLDDLKRELKRSVGSLRGTQSFNVILFFGIDDKAAAESFSAALESGSSETKRRFFNWLDRKAPTGQTEPLIAMRRALAQRPEVIFFISDGLFDDGIVDEVTKANKEIGVQINCLLFDESLLEDRSGLPKATSGAQRLQKIAQQNRGKIKIVTGSDLKRG